MYLFGKSTQKESEYDIEIFLMKHIIFLTRTLKNNENYCLCTWLPYLEMIAFIHIYI